MTASHGTKCVLSHTHTCMHAHRLASNHIHSFIHLFAGLFGFGLSIFLFYVHNTQQMLSGFTKPLLTHARTIFARLFSLKNNHDRQQQSKNARTLTQTETTFKNCTLQPYLDSRALFHLAFSLIERWVENRERKREIIAEHNEPSILKLH